MNGQCDAEVKRGALWCACRRRAVAELATYYHGRYVHTLDACRDHVARLSAPSANVTRVVHKK